jgi:hypothetical protein
VLRQLQVFGLAQWCITYAALGDGVGKLATAMHSDRMASAAKVDT